MVTTFQAHQKGKEEKPHPAAKRLMRIFKKDMLIWEKDGEEVVGFVQKLSLKQGLIVVPHTEANADSRDRNKADPFKFIYMGAGSLSRFKARRVYVDELGRLRDPGPVT